MNKEQVGEFFNVARQTLPFFMITITFISIAYTYAHTFSALEVDPTLELTRLSCNYLP
jgi:hypothetical protein